MEKYLLFAGSNYYPSGGMGDFQKGFETINEAKDYFNEVKDNNYWGWCQVVEYANLEVVYYA